MVDMTQIYPYVTSGARGVYDYAIDGASDLVDGTLEAAKNSLTSLIPITLLNKATLSSYVEVVKVPDVISDVLFGITNIPSKARHVLDGFWDAASQAARGIWNAIDVPGIDAEAIYDSIVSGGKWLYGALFGEDEVAVAPTTETASNLISGAEELTRQVVAKVDEGTQTARVVRSSSSSIGSIGSTSSNAPVTATSLSVPAPESGSGLTAVVSSIPPPADAVIAASSVATVSTGEVVVVGLPPTGTTESDGDGVEVSTEESSTGGVIQTILNFLTGTSTTTSSASNVSTQNNAATAQVSGLSLLFGIAGHSGSVRSTVRSSAVPVVNTLPGRVVDALGGGSQSTTLGDFVLELFTGDSETANITNSPSSFSVGQTLFHAAVSRVLGSHENSLPSYRGSLLGSSIPQGVATAGLNNIADIAYVPYSAGLSSRISLGQADPTSSNLETVGVVAALADDVNGIHMNTDTNPHSGSQGGEQNAFETMRDLELAQSLNNPSLEEPVFVDSSLIIRQSNQASVAV